MPDWDFQNKDFATDDLEERTWAKRVRKRTSLACWRKFCQLSPPLPVAQSTSEWLRNSTLGHWVDVEGGCGQELFTGTLQGGICGIIQAVQHGYPQLSRSGEGVLHGLMHSEAKAQHSHCHELRAVCASEGKRAPAPAQDRIRGRGGGMNRVHRVST